MSTSPSSLSRSQLLVANPQPVSNFSATSTFQRPRLNESKKSPYNVAHQVTFLYLQAEVELLLQQLQILKQQRIVTPNYDAGLNRHWPKKGFLEQLPLLPGAPPALWADLTLENDYFAVGGVPPMWS